MYTFILIAGLLVLFAAFYLLRKQLLFIKNGIRVEARVFVFSITRDDENNNETYSPVFRFHTPDNLEIVFKPQLARYNRIWLAGDKATFVYQKDNPHKPVLLSYWSMFRKVIFLFSVAIFLLTIAGCYYWAQHFFKTLTSSN